jgi:hypothetical protein
VRLERPRILASAARAVRHGGLLMIVDHGSAPPWASKLDDVPEFPTPEEVIDGLNLRPGDFDRVRVEEVERNVTRPDGKVVPWMDNVIVLRRRESP